MKKILLTALVLAGFSATAQVKVGNNPTTINANSVLEMESTNKGMLLPRVALTSTTSFAPLSAHVAGMKVYNTATAGTGETAVLPGEYYNNGTGWVKVAEGNPEFEAALTVYVNNSDPNTATTFDDVPTVDETGAVNPDYVDDPTLEQNTTYAYSGVDGSLWRWNGTAYVALTSAAKTEWNLSGTTTDAGSNKTSDISRVGDVGIGGSTQAYYKLTTRADTFLGSTTKYAYGQYNNSSPAQITANGANYQYGNMNYQSRNIATGVTDTGTMLGVYANIVRTGAGNDGTMSSTTAIRALAGNYGHSGTGGTGTTSTVYGLYLTSYSNWGTITNMYDIRAFPSSALGTVGTHWGLYIDNSTNNTAGVKKNYIGGVLGVATVSGLGIDYAAGEYRFIVNGLSNINGLTVGRGKMQPSYGTVFGQGAMPLATGNYNVAIGPNALFSATTGGGNVAVGGLYTLQNLTTGSNNTAIGTYAMRSLVDGSHNLALGYDAAQAATGGNYNISFGYRANNLLETGADYNIGIGYTANYVLTTGKGNTSLGTSAGDSITTGNNNTSLGRNASNITTGSSNMVLGYNATVADPAADNQMSIMNTIYGLEMGTVTSKVGIGTNAPTDKLDVRGSIRMVDGNQAEGKIMVSDANGKATWGDASLSQNGVTKVSPIHSTTGRIWMDRNLGAARRANAIDDYLAYGQLYQWGRGNDGHADINYTSSTVGTAANGVTATTSATDYPDDNLFITIAADWRTTKNDNLWQGVNGINNPCPAGFRLPTSAEFTAEITAYSITSGATGFTSPLKITLPGYRVNTSGAISSESTVAYYWTSTVSGTAAIRRDFTATTATVTTTGSRSHGMTVRCIKAIAGANYVDNAAAVAAGLQKGDTFQSGDGVLRIVY